jgi:hypothetical protein
MSMNKTVLSSLIVAALAGSAFAAIPNGDIADNSPYPTNNWTGGQNGGFGWGNWVHQVSTGGAFAGAFTAGNSNGDLEDIKSPNHAWGSFANGNGQQKFAAFRRLQGDDFNTANLVNFQSIIMSIEHGDIQNGGFAGMGWGARSFSNADPRASGLSGALFDQALFGFYGGQSNYTLQDALGTLDTGIPFTNRGLRVTFTLTNSLTGTYDLTVERLGPSPQVWNFNNRQINGGIDAISLYNFDAEFGNVYFNSVSLIPAPGAAALLGLGGLLAARRRR